MTRRADKDTTGEPAGDVLDHRHWLQVVRVHAPTIPTQVVECHLLLNRPDQISPDDSMREYLPGRFALDSPIAFGVEIPGPLPTIAGGVDGIRDRGMNGPGRIYPRSEKIKRH
jgi:hypothetical protein